MATILSGGDEGKYRVTVKYDRRRAEAEITKLQAEIPGLQTAITDMGPEITQAENDLVYLHQVLSAKIHALGQSAPGTTEQSSAQTAVREAKKDVDKQDMVLAGLRQERRRLEFEVARRETRIRFLQTSIPEDYETDAWCADYSEDLTGDVGIIEPGRVAPDRLPTIMPGGPAGDQAAHQVARDGKLQPVNAGTAANAFYNYAMLPGAARWRPRYRSGTIDAINGESCTVTLDGLLLTHQRLPAGPTETLHDVPIEYMDCNESAFEVGDHVIVAFEDQTPERPKVIGFVDNPRPCAGHRISLTPRTNSQSSWPSLVEVKSGAWSLATAADVNSGNLDWKGQGAKEMLTWHGPTGRYPSGAMGDGTFSAEIFRRGRVFATAPAEVYGVGVCTDSAGARWLLAVCRDGSDVALFRAPYLQGVAGLYSTGGPDGNPNGWRQVSKLADGWLSSLTAYTINRSGGRVTGRKRGGWFFSSDGSHAASMVWASFVDPGAGYDVDIDIPLEISINPDTWAVSERWLLSWGGAPVWGADPSGMPHGVSNSVVSSVEGELWYGGTGTREHITSASRIWAVDYVGNGIAAVTEQDDVSTTWIDEDFGGAGGGHRATDARNRTLTLSARGTALPDIVLVGSEITVDYQAPVDASGDFTVTRTLSRTRIGIGTGASVYFVGGDLRAGLIVVDCYGEWDSAAGRIYTAEYEKIPPPGSGHILVSESDVGQKSTNHTQFARAYLRGVSLGQSSHTISTEIDGVLPAWILPDVRANAWKNENYSTTYHMTTVYAASSNYRLFVAAVNKGAEDAFIISLAKFFRAFGVSGWCPFLNTGRPGGIELIVPLPEGAYPRYWPIVPV